MMKAVEFVKNQKAKGNYLVLVSLDIQGTFDNVARDLILRTLRRTPIDKNLIILIKSYFRNVSFFVGNAIINRLGRAEN